MGITQNVGQLAGRIPVGSVVRVKRCGTDWCIDSKGNTYFLDVHADEFVARIETELAPSDVITTGAVKERKHAKCTQARLYSWRLPRHWTITLTRSATSS